MLIEIREVRPQELQLLLEIAKNTFIDTYESLNDPVDFKKYIQQNFTIDTITTQFNHPSSTFYFATCDDQVIGYTKLNTDDAQTEDIPDAFEVERIYVLWAYKGKGIGKSLIQHAKETAGQAGLSKIWLGVWEKNPEAIAFYERMGFSIVGTHTFTIGTDVQTDYMMELNL